MKKCFICLCVLAMGTVVFAEGKDQAESQKEKPDYRSFVVNAWLVKVDAEALYKSGVKPLSEKEKENVSIMNLLWCLGEPNSGKVIISAETKAGCNEEGETSFKMTKYFKVVREGNLFDVMRLDNSVRFTTQLWMSDDKKHIRLEYSFNTNTFDEDEAQKSGLQPSTISMNNTSVTYVMPGKPVIASHTQIEDDMFFLVLMAEVVE